MHEKRSREAFAATGRKAWKVPAVARLKAGSAEEGGGNDEDAFFTAS